MSPVIPIHQTYRQNQVTRLANAAMVAVRRTEAGYVRPILGDRMTETVQSFVARHTVIDTVRFRVLLFGELHRTMRLTAEEKTIAKTSALHHFIELLRGMPNPPIRVHDDEAVTKHLHALNEQIETAYGLRLRPSLELMQQLGQFCGTSSLSTAV